MEEILACRICLITDAKLYNMYKHSLVESYEIVTGNQVRFIDIIIINTLSITIISVYKYLKLLK